MALPVYPITDTDTNPPVATVGSTGGTRLNVPPLKNTASTPVTVTITAAEENTQVSPLLLILAIVGLWILAEVIGG